MAKTWKGTIAQCVGILAIGAGFGRYVIYPLAKQKQAHITIERDVAEAKGYDVMIERDWGLTTLRVGTYEGTRFVDGNLIYARDRNSDGRIDEVILHGPKGNPLEELASIPTLSGILEKVAKKQ